MNRIFLLFALLSLALASPATAQSSRRGGEAQSPQGLSASEVEWCNRVQQDIDARTRWLTQERAALARQSGRIDGLGVSADQTAGGAPRTPQQTAAYNGLVAEHRELVNAYNARLTVVGEQSSIVLRSIEILRERCLRQPAPQAQQAQQAPRAPRRTRPADD